MAKLRYHALAAKAPVFSRPCIFNPIGIAFCRGQPPIGHERGGEKKVLHSCWLCTVSRCFTSQPGKKPNNRLTKTIPQALYSACKGTGCTAHIYDDTGTMALSVQCAPHWMEHPVLCPQRNELLRFPGTRPIEKYAAVRNRKRSTQFATSRHTRRDDGPRPITW